MDIIPPIPMFGENEFDIEISHPFFLKVLDLLEVQ